MAKHHDADRVPARIDDAEADLRAIDEAAGVWQGRDEDSAAYVERLRSGRRLDEVLDR